MEAQAFEKARYSGHAAWQVRIDALLPVECVGVRPAKMTDFHTVRVNA
jgi:hypothetical protein